MSSFKFVMSSVRCRCQISFGVGGGGQGPGIVKIFKLLKALIGKFLEIASVNRKSAKSERK